MCFFQGRNAALQFVNLGHAGQCPNGSQQLGTMSRRKLISGHSGQGLTH